MRAQVQKWGNSLALRIPKALAVETALEQGSEVDLSLVAGSLVVTPTRQAAYTLESLLAGVTGANRHGEVDTGAPAGREAW
jgi:antitoxin MazE